MCMPINTRSNKKGFLFVILDPTQLGRVIRKQKRIASIDTSQVSIDTTRNSSSIDTPLASTDTNLQQKEMVAPIILIQNADGVLHDRDGHLRNSARQR